MNPTLLSLPTEELKAMLASWQGRSSSNSPGAMVRQLLHLEQCQWDKTWAALSWEDAT